MRAGLFVLRDFLIDIENLQDKQQMAKGY